MANVQGFRDINNDNNQGGRNNIREPDQQIRQNKIPFINTLVSTRPHMDQIIPYTLRLVWCPSLTIFTFYFFILDFQLGVWMLWRSDCLHDHKLENFRQSEITIMLRYWAYLFISIFMSLGMTGVDFAGQMRGLAGGLACELAIFPGIKPKNHAFTIGGAAILVSYLLTMFLVFFLAKS